jgi:hypothetical protein
MNLVPQHLREDWLLDKPDIAENSSLNHQAYSVKELINSLHFGDNEMSGALGYGWITRVLGSRNSVPCQSNHFFSWHYHPDNDCQFSLVDWLTFVLADAPISLLITRDAVCLFEKAQGGNWEKHKEKLNQTNKKGLNFLRFKKFLEKKMEHSDFWEWKDQKIGSILGINHNLYEIKT